MPAVVNAIVNGCRLASPAPLVITSHKSRFGCACNSSNIHPETLNPCLFFTSADKTRYTLFVGVYIILFRERTNFIRFFNAGHWSTIATATSKIIDACSLSVAQPYTSAAYSPSPHVNNNANPAPISDLPCFFGTSKYAVLYCLYPVFVFIVPNTSRMNSSCQSIKSNGNPYHSPLVCFKH